MSPLLQALLVLIGSFAGGGLFKVVLDDRRARRAAALIAEPDAELARVIGINEALARDNARMERRIDALEEDLADERNRADAERSRSEGLREQLIEVREELARLRTEVAELKGMQTP